MRVRCITIFIDNPITELEECGWSNADGYLTVNKEYTVYAKYYSWFSGIDAYLVCDDNYNDRDYYWPVYIPICYFEVIDSEKPSFWTITTKDPGYEGPNELIPSKYEALLNGNAEVISAFRRIKKMSEDENDDLWDRRPLLSGHGEQ